MTESDGGDADTDAGADAGADTDADAPAGDVDEQRSSGRGTSSGDTFGVGIHVTEADLQFVVHVPSDIDSGWTDPDEFQRLVERVVWDELDRESTLRGIARRADTGDTVTLGRVTLRPDGTVVETRLNAPERDAADGDARTDP